MNTTDTEAFKQSIKQRTMEFISQQTGGSIESGRVSTPQGFTIAVQIGKLQEYGSSYICQTIFITEYDGFDEPLIEPVEAEGPDVDSCASMSAQMYLGGVWYPLMQAADNRDPVVIKSSGPFDTQTFRMYYRSIVRVGIKNKQPFPIVDLIINELPKYLGTKKYYWLRVCLTKYQEKYKIEVRINGSVCADLDRYFTDYAEKQMHAEDTFVMEKQYAIFVNEADDACPFDKDIVSKAASMYIGLLENAQPGRNTLADLSAELTDSIRLDLPSDLDPAEADRTAIALSGEIRIFVPEIFAKIAMTYSEGDSLFLLGKEEPDGTRKQTELKKSQLRSYFYIQQAVLEYLGKRPPRENVEKIVVNSAAYREVRKILDAAEKEGRGISVNDLRVPGTSYLISAEGYRIW